MKYHIYPEVDQRFNIAANASSFRSRARISARSSSVGIAYAHSISYSRGQSDSQATSSPGATVVPDAEAFCFDAALRFSELARVLVRLNHVASIVVHANHFVVAVRSAKAAEFAA